MVDKMLCACRHVLQKRLMQREGCGMRRVLTAATRGLWKPTAATHPSSFTVKSRSHAMDIIIIIITRHTHAPL